MLKTFTSGDEHFNLLYQIEIDSGKIRARYDTEQGRSTISSAYGSDPKSILESNHVKRISGDDYYIKNTFHQISVLEVSVSKNTDTPNCVSFKRIWKGYTKVFTSVSGIRAVYSWFTKIFLYTHFISEKQKNLSNKNSVNWIRIRDIYISHIHIVFFETVLEVGKSVAITISVRFPEINKVEIERAKSIIESEGQCHLVKSVNTIRNIGRILSEDASLSVFVLDLNGKVIFMKTNHIHTPGLLQKIRKKCKSPGIFSVSVLGVFFRKFEKIAKCNSPRVSTVILFVTCVHFQDFQKIWKFLNQNCKYRSNWGYGGDYFLTRNFLHQEIFNTKFFYPEKF